VLESPGQDLEKLDKTDDQSENIRTLVIRQEVTESQLFLNLIKMTIMWTQASFN